jgi:hypothetical protein
VADPGTPDWWLGRLYKRLDARRSDIDFADAWYSGSHPMPRGFERAVELLRRLHDAAETNFLALLVDAAHERMHVEGFKVDGTVNDAVWTVWQGNGLDAGSEEVFLESMALGEASVLVDPTANAFGYPTVTPEHPAQTIVEYQPGSRTERTAGLKVWVDDLAYDGPEMVAMVYLADRVEQYRASAPRNLGDRTATWGPTPTWEYQPDESGRNELGEVPLVDFRCRPRMLKPGTPEFTRAIPIQRRINKTVLDRMVNQEYGAFKQKWVTGMEIPTDPVTGQQVEPFKAALDHIIMAEDPAATFGQFETEDLQQLINAVAADVQHMAAIVPTPPHYLLGQLTNLSAEALKAAEAALVSRIRRHERHYEEPLETVARLMLKASGESVPNVAGMQTIWRNPEFRTEGELVDALLKMSTLGVPREALWERWGATPQEITAWSAQADVQAARDAAATAGLLAVPTFGAPLPPGP